MIIPQSNEKIVNQILCWIEELKWAESVCLLREVFVQDTSRWYALQASLLHQSEGLGEPMVTVLGASCSEDVSMYYTLVPGLRAMTSPDKKSTSVTQQEEGILSTERKNGQDFENFWEKFCSENPEELECRIYEV